MNIVEAVLGGLAFNHLRAVLQLGYVAVVICKKKKRHK